MCCGAARGLRAWGYYTFWAYGTSGAEVIIRAADDGLVIVTGDAGLMARRVITSGELRAIHIPAGLDRWGQTAVVIRTFGLECREPRCMHCGGELARVGKEAYKDELPPRTYAWLDEFWRCSDCGKFFWKGTHWERIAARLEDLSAGLNRTGTE